VTTALFPVAVLVAAFALSAGLVPLAGWIARRYGVMDAPGPRKVHDRPTPRVGGLAVFATFMVVVLAGYLGVPVVTQLDWVRTHLAAPVAMLQEAYRVQAKLSALLVGATIVFLVGLLDDVMGSRFPVGFKLAGQVLAALILIAGGVRTDFLYHPSLNVAFTLVWVVGITNAFNLLDNMDGLSAGVAFVASSVLLVNAWHLGEFFISLVFVAFMGSVLGFLFHNWHPARIFLGDCGSLFIGFVLASVTLLEHYVSHASSSYFPILMPVLVLALPILDTATVTFIRIREGRPIYVGDSRHLSHRLVSIGMTPPLAVLTIYVITLALGLGAVTLPHASLVQSLLILLQALAVVAVVLILLFFERRVQPRRSAP
jgi:UDP-GlcNAc:undecaprenyl-phosphate GlcNAc-1-phosphate transferase